MVEDVFGLNKELLAEWKSLNEKSSNLKPRYLEYSKNGRKVTAELILEMYETEKKMKEVSEKMIP
jgi:hypothetical protein